MFLPNIKLYGIQWRDHRFFCGREKIKTILIYMYIYIFVPKSKLLKNEIKESTFL